MSIFQINAQTLMYNKAEQNQPHGLVVLGSDGKIPSNVYEAGGNTDLSSYTGFVDITGKNGDSTIHAADGNLVLSSDSNVVLGGIYVACQSDFITPSVSSESSDLVIMTSNNSDAIVLAPGSFGSNPEESRSGTIKLYADSVLFNGSAYNTANGFAVIGNDGKLPASILPESSGGDTSALEERVTTLESTVGTLDAAVDEILADYGEGSGALVYRVVASATEPENPTEGMIWIQTE